MLIVFAVSQTDHIHHINGDRLPGGRYAQQGAGMRARNCLARRHDVALGYLLLNVHLHSGERGPQDVVENMQLGNDFLVETLHNLFIELSESLTP